MTTQTYLGGSFALPNTSITVNRMGYGAMRTLTEVFIKQVTTMTQL